MSSPLIWEGNELYQQKADTFIRKPIDLEDNQLFKKKVFPIKRVIGIFGRDGSDKRASIVAFLKRHLPLDGLVFEVSVRYGETLNAIEDMASFTSGRLNAIFETNAAFPLPQDSSCDQATAALVVEHADILAYEPDNEKTMRFMLKLRSLAEKTEILVILLFDRLLSDPDTVMPTKQYRAALARDIDVCLYMGAPDAEFRTALLREQFAMHVANAEPPIQDVLSEGDYTMLADNTAGATPCQIREFVRRVFDDLTSKYPCVYCREFGAPADAPRKLNMAVLQSHMSTASGSLLILPNNGRTAEAAFEEAIAKSSSVVAAPARTLAKEERPTKNKRSRMMEAEEAQEEKY